MILNKEIITCLLYLVVSAALWIWFPKVRRNDYTTPLVYPCKSVLSPFTLCSAVICPSFESLNAPIPGLLPLTPDFSGDKSNSSYSSFKYWKSFVLAFLLLLFAVSTQAASITSTGSGGNWSDGATWVGGSVPARGDDVTIVAGATVTIDSDAAVGNLTISGTLQYEASTARTLTAAGIVTINSAGIFKSAPSGSTSIITTHSLVVGGSIISNGTINFSATAGAGGTTANASGAGITFTGTSNATFDFSTATLTNLRQTNGVVLNKGTSAASVLSFTPGNTFQVLSDGSSNAKGFLSIINGTFNLIGSNSFSNPVFNTEGDYTIPATGGFWLGSQNATVIGMNGTVTNLGDLKISNGTYNIGNAAGNSLETLNDGQFKMSGGIMNIPGRLKIDGSICTISGGKINLATQANSAGNEPALSISEQAKLEIYGNPFITLAYPNSKITPSNDIQVQYGSGSKSISGGVIQLGTEATPAGSTFLVNGDLILDNLTVFNECTIHVFNTSKSDITNTPISSLPKIVFDKIAPELTAPAKITIQCGENLPRLYSSLQEFTNAGGAASDNCTLEPASFKFAGQVQSSTTCPYTVTRTYAISDVSGNVGTAEHLIVVEGGAVETPTETVVEPAKEEVLRLKSAMAGTVTAVANGNWNVGSTWSTGVVPAFDDDVIIPNGFTVAIDAAAVCNDITIQSGGTINYSGANTLQVYGDWTNNGTYNGGTNGIVEFTGTSGATISGTTNFEELIITKGSLNTTLTISGPTTVTSGGSLLLTSGLITIPVGGSFTINPSSALRIEKPAGFDLTGGNLSTGNFTITNEGLIRVSSGTANFGNSSGNSVHTQVDGAFVVTGGTVNIAGRLENSASGTLTPPGLPSGISISGGTITLATQGNGLSNVGTLNVTSAGTFNFTGGTLVFQNESTATTALDLGLIGGTGAKNTVGGTFQFGNSSTPAGSVFNISSEILLNSVTSSANADIKLADNIKIGQLALNSNSTIDLNGYEIQLVVTSTGTYTFPLDNGSGVSIPVSVQLTSGTFASGAYITLETTGTDHPNNASATNYLNRYWTVTTSGITSPVYNVTATYADTDVPVTATETEIAMGSWTGALPWVKYADVNAATNTLSATGITATSFVFAGITSDPPTVTVTASPSAICLGASSSLTTTASGDPTLTYSWASTPAGFTSTNPNITVNPAVSTTYTVIVTDGNGFTATDNIIINVNPLPTPTLTSSDADNTFCTGTSVTFTAGGGTNYNFRVAGSSVQNGASTTYTTSALTNGQVVDVIVTNASGCTATSTGITNTVNDLPTPTLTSSDADNTFCAGTSVTFTAGGGTNYNFRVAGSSVQNGASTTYTTSALTNAQVVDVIVTTASGCTATSTGINNTVNPLPTATAGSNSPQCTGQTLNLTASGGASYSWTGPNGFTSASQNPTIANVTTAASGTYTVTVTDGNGCSSIASTSVTVNPAPSVSITANPGNVICSGDNVTFTASPTNTGANPTYQWQINGVNVSGETNATFSSSTLANAQQVRVIVTADPSYCSSTATSNIYTMTVNPPVIPTVSILESANPICEGTTVNFSSIVVNGGAAPTYQWQINGAPVAGATNSSFFSSSLVNGDQVRVVVTSNATCAINNPATSSPITMTVNPLVTPTVSIIADQTTICPGTTVIFTATPANGGSNPIYQWKINGADVGSNNPTFTTSTLANNDVISVLMTSNATCVSPSLATSNNITMTVNAGAPAIPGAITGNALVCPAISETYTIAAVPNATSYTWTFPSGWTGTSTTNSISLTTGATGQNGNITVTASNSCGTSAPRTLAVTVGSLSTAPTGVTITDNNTCFGTSKTLSVTGGSLGTGAGWEWFTGSCGGTPAGTGASITVNPAAGTSTTYYVRSAGTCNTTTCTEGTVTVSPAAPAQPGAITGTTPVCPAITDLTYSIPAVADATSYNWTVPTGWNITAGQGTISITVTAGAAGQNGNISVTATNSCGTSSAQTLAVTVGSGIPATPGVITGLSDQCINTSGLVYSIAAVPSATTYTWTVPAGWNVTAGAGTTSITVSTTAGAVSGNITVTAGNTCGTSSATTLAVIASPAAPAAPATPTGPNSICPPANVLVYSVSAVANATSFNWTLPTPGWTIISGAGTNSITVNVGSTANTGAQNITVTAQNACGISSASLPFSVTVGTFTFADAGSDIFVCAGSTSVDYTATVGGATSGINDVQWSSSSGAPSNRFTNTGKRASGTYTFLPADIAAGIVTLTITTAPEGTCTPMVDQVVVRFLPNPTASISGTTTICAGSSSTITFTATANTTVTYTINGGANQTIAVGASGIATLNTGVLTSNSTYSLVSVIYSTTPTCTLQTASGSAVITVNPAATVNAGGTIEACQSATPSAITLAGASVGGGATTGAWSITSGGGILSSEAQTATPASVTYTPAANFSGTVTLTLTTNAPGACAAVSATRIITVNAAPTVNAGGPDVVCQSATPSSITLAGASIGGGATTGAWSITSGGGTLSSLAQTATPATVTYTPAANFSGTVTLTLTTDAPTACAAVSATRILVVNPLATVNAGTDQTVCASSPVTLAGTVGGGANAGTWSGGTGTFSPDASTLTATYTPSAAEISDGIVLLTLTTEDPDGPCGVVSDQVQITISPTATVNAGLDQILCEGSNLILSGSIGGSASSGTWSGGSGTFSPNNSTLNATYTPGVGETGLVTLTLTTDDPAGSCAAATDQLVINIDPKPIVSAGTNQTICSDGTVTLNGSFSGAASAAWSTSGNGTFSPNNATSNAVYTPGSSDIFNGTVTLTYETNDPAGPCGPASASITITIKDKIAITTQPVNTGVCSSYPANITVAAVGDDLTYQWYKGTAPGIAVSNSGNISGAQSATLHFNNATASDAGSYYVVISGATECSPVTSSVITLNVDQEITITTQVQSNTVCVGDPVTFLLEAEPGGLLTFQWRKNGIDITGQTSNTLNLGNVTLADAGAYDVLIEGLAGYTCSSAQSATATLTVTEDGTIVLSGGTSTPTLCIDIPLSAITYAIGGSTTGATITAGALPAGVAGTFNSGVFTVNGTPTEAGTFNYTVTTTGSPCLNPSLSGTITVNGNGTISLSGGNATPTVCINTALPAITYAIGGTATGSTVTGLPSGVSGSYSGGVFTISGTPTVVGTYTFTVTTTGSPCVNPSLSGTITVSDIGTITLSGGTSTPTLCVNTPLSDITYAISGSATGVSFSGAYPAGVTGSYNSGVYTISGTPTATGTFTYTLTTTGTCANSSVSGNITVNDNGTISLSGGNATPTVCVNTALPAITYAIGGNATGADVSGLPAGVTGSYSAGVYTIGGTPTVVGTFAFTVTTTGSSCVNPSLSGTITVSDNGTISLTSGDPNQTVCINTPITSVTYAVGGSATGVTSANLPSGVTGTYNAGVYTISGTPNASGTFNFTLTTIGTCASGTLTGTLTVNPLSVGGVISPALSTVCTTTNNGTLTLSGITGTILRWESTMDAGVTWTTIANTATTHDYTNLPLTTWFRAVVQSGVCPPIYSALARVNVIPLAVPIVTTTNSDLCSGDFTVLTAITDILQPVGAFPGGDFNQANPAGWRVTENGVEIKFPASADNTITGPWAETNGPKTFNGVTYDTSDNTKFSIARGIVNTTMETPVFNLFGLPSAALTFKQAYNLLPGTTAQIELSTDGGNTYGIVLAQYTGTLTAGMPNVINPMSIDMSAYLNMSNLRIRFNYVSTTASGWAVDGIGIPGQQTEVTYQWSPTETLDPPTGSPVTATPGETTTYTLTMTISGCPVTVTSIVITVATPGVVTTSNACIGGGTVTFTQAGGTLGGTWTVSGGGTIDAATGEFTPVSSGCFTATYTTGAATCISNEKFVVFPEAPLPDVNAGCGLIVVTPPVAVPGFTLQYSFDDGATWGDSNAAPTADNCAGYSIRTRYITTSDCGTISASTTSTIAGCDMSPAYIKVVDTTSPTITCPPTATGNTDANECYSTTVVLGTATATDNCSVVTVTNDAPAQFPAGTTTVTWTATDACGNSATCTQIVVVTDTTQPPTITCPSSVEETIAADQCSKTGVSPGTPTVWDNCPNPVLTYTLTGATTGSGAGTLSNTTFNVGVTTVTYTVTDLGGNMVSCTFTVTILRLDIPPAVITCPASPSPVDAAAGTCFAPVTVASPLEVDPCATASYTFVNNFNGTDNASGSYPVGTTTVTWTITDNSGNVNTCVQTVNVTDTQTPTITCQSDVEETIASNNCSKTGVAITDPAVSDNCPNPDLTWVLTGATTGSGSGPIPSNQAFNVGVTTVTYTVTDDGGLTASCSFHVWIKNLVLPQFSVACPTSPITATASAGVCDVTVTVPSPAITNPCNEVYSMVNDYNGTETATDTYNIGTTTVTWTIIDASGNITTCVQTVIVSDTQTPTITCQSDVEETIASNNCSKTGVAITDPTVNDNCPNPDLTWVLTGATTGSGTGPILSSQAFNVGVTTVTYTVTDDGGLTASCSFHVWIKNLVLPQFSVACPTSPITSTTSAGVCDATVTVPSPAITNPCNEVYSMVNDYNGTETATDTYNIGTTTVTWTIVDASGNITTCVQTVIVSDTQTPTITCQSDVEETIASNNCSKTGVTLTNPGINDNCPNPVLTWILTGATTGSGSGPIPLSQPFNVGVTTVTYTVTDTGGLSASCSFHVWIKNLVLPQFSVTCPTTPILANTAAGNCDAVVTVPSPGINNPCNELYTIVNDYNGTETATDTYNIGTTTVTWTIVDASGNITTCVQTVIVSDTQTPTITCQSDVEETIASNNCSKTGVTLTNPGINDNCPNPVLTWILTGATTGSGNGPIPLSQPFNVGVTTVTYTVTDTGGLSASCSFHVWIKNLVLPQFSVACPTSPIISTASAGVCDATVTVPSPAITNPCNEVYSMVNDYNGTETATDTYNIGTTTVTWTIIDASGNITTCVQTVIVTDTQAPVFTTCPSDYEQQVLNGGCDLANVNVPQPDYTDNCPNPVLTYELTLPNGTTVSGTGSVTGLTFSVGITTVTYTVTDASTNTATCTFTVWIKNLNAPQFSASCPVDVTVPADTYECDAVVSVPSPGITNPCNEVYTVFNNSPYKTSDTDASGTYPLGTTTVTWSVTDASGKITTCTQLVTVTDLMPIIDCPDDITDLADFELPYKDAVTVPHPTYSDNCPDPVLTWEMTGVTTGSSTNTTGESFVPSPGRFNLGVTSVTYTVTDSNGNSVSCTFTVTISGKPLIDCPATITSTTDANVCTKALDPGVPVLRLNSPAADSWSWVMTGATTGSGGNNGSAPLPVTPNPFTFNVGVTTITWTACNISGCSSCTQEVTVEDKEPPTFTPATITECVDLVYSAVYTASSPNPNSGIDPNLIIVPSPDYYTFKAGDISLDLTDLDDNCCGTASLTVNWRIEFAPVPDPLNPTGPALTHADITGTGQPSAYGSDILMWGDGVNFTTVTHSIFYWVEDCNGNTSGEQRGEINITPRPNIIKMN